MKEMILRRVITSYNITSGAGYADADGLQAEKVNKLIEAVELDGYKLHSISTHESSTAALLGVGGASDIDVVSMIWFKKDAPFQGSGTKFLGYGEIQ